MRSPGKSALGIGRSFDGVDVIVDRAHVVGVATNDRFESRDDLFGAFFGRAVGAPEAPGVNVHGSFGEEGGGVEIVGIFFGEFAHGVAIVAGGLMHVDVGAGFGKALGHGEYVVAFAVRGVVGGSAGGGEVESFLDGVVGLFEARVVGGIVVIGADGFGNTPVGHGEGGLEFGGMIEGAKSFVVIEGVDLAEALVEEFLGVGIFCGGGMVEVGVTGHEDDGAGVFGLGTSDGR